MNFNSLVNRIRLLFKHSARSYLDVASSTPIDIDMMQRIPRVPAAILGANPSALHSEGVKARRYIDEARARIATVLHAHLDEIIFTSGATESDNFALRGVIDDARARGVLPNHILVIASELEHAAVLETIGTYKALGVSVESLPVVDGVIDPKSIIIPLGSNVIVISVMYVNNEIGTVQPIHDIAKRVRYLRKHHPHVQIFFHCDATQAPAHFSLNVSKLGVDLMTLGATKLYCPKGVGVLYKKRNVMLSPIMYGGGQEYGMRPGTEAIDLIHYFSYALEYADTIKEAETERIKELQTYFETKLTQEISDVIITGKDYLAVRPPSERSPHITHIALKGFDSELLVIEFDARGIAVSAKSACKNEDGTESSLVTSLYGNAYGAVRFSFGRTTTVRDLDQAIRALRTIIEKYAPVI